MRILFLAGREVSYARNEVLLRAFRRLGTVQVIASAQAPRSLFGNSVRIAAAALRHLVMGQHDLVFIGFYGHFLVRLLGPLIRRPILFDAFVSTYDTLCFDRQRCRPDSLPGRAAFWLDRSTCQLADHVLLDTPQHVDYFVQTFSLPPSKFTAIPVGCSEEIYGPHVQPAPRPTGQTLVLSYTTFLPLHGLEIILQAAAHLRDQPIQLRLIGDGPLLPAMKQLADELQLTNVTFAPPVPPATLATEIAAADICLGGHFGASDKAGRVVPGKLYQMLAMGKALIASNAPANRDLLQHGDNAWLIPPADPQALAAAIRTLHGDAALRTRLASQARALYTSHCSEAIITRQLHQVVTQSLHLTTRFSNPPIP